MDSTCLDDEMREQVTAVIDSQAKEPFGVYVWADPDPATALARYVERVVFDDSFGNSPEILDVEYGNYEAASLFICAIDHHRRLPVGMSRAILPSAAGLKSLNDVSREWAEDIDNVLTRTGLHFQHELVWDCATLAVMADYRGAATHGNISMALCQTVATAALRCGFGWLVSVFDMPVFQLIQSRLGRPFETYEGVGAMPYLGSSASIPVWSDLPAWSARLARSNAVQRDLIFGGHGVGHTVAPPDWGVVEELVGRVLERRPMESGSPAPA